MTVRGMWYNDKVLVERKKHKGCDITRKYQKTKEKEMEVNRNKMWKGTG